MKLTLRLLILGAVALTVSAAAPATQPLTLTIDPVSSFSGLNMVQLSGTKDAGSTVTVQPVAPAKIAPCPPVSGGGTTWNCVVAVPNGPGVTVTVGETLNTDSTTVVTRPFDVLGPPTIDGANNFVTTGLISGQGYSGSTVTATVADSPSGGCSSPVVASGYWSCSLTVPSGPWLVTTTQARADLGGGHPSSVSGSLNVVVDKAPPNPPVVTSPSAGSRVSGSTVAFAGTGETGASLDVYIDKVPVCSSAVTADGWNCSAVAPTSGSHSILAIQHDAAGNFSSPSAAVTVQFGVPPLGAVPSTPPAASPQPSRAPPTAAPRSATPKTPAPIPATPRFDTAPPTNPPPSGWTTPTNFGSLLPSLTATIDSGNLLFAPLAAIAFLVLIALPIRLLATELRGHSWRPLKFMGRNQGRRPDPTQQVPVTPRLVRFLPLVVAVGLIVFSSSVNDEPRFLRLSIGVTLGLVTLNLLGVVLPAWFVGRRLGASGRLRFTTLLMVACGVTAVLSRITEIHPRIIAGVLVGTVFTGTIAIRSRAIVRLAEVAGITVLAVVGWIGHGFLLNSTAFVPMLGRELLATIALAGLGSAIVMMLPIANLPGRAVMEWSFPAWLVSALAVTTIAAVVFVGTGPANFPMIGALVIATACAVLSLSAWAWLKFVEPAAAH